MGFGAIALAALLTVNVGIVCNNGSNSATLTLDKLEAMAFVEREGVQACQESLTYYDKDYTVGSVMECKRNGVVCGHSCTCRYLPGYSNFCTTSMCIN